MNAQPTPVAPQIGGDLIKGSNWELNVEEIIQIDQHKSK